MNEIGLKKIFFYFHGTWPHIKKLIGNVMETAILNGKHEVADEVWPRMSLMPTYSVQIQTLAVSRSTRICHKHNQSTGSVVKRLWAEFRESLFYPSPPLCDVLTKWKSIIFIHLRAKGEKKYRLCILKPFINRFTKQTGNRHCFK